MAKICLVVFLLLLTKQTCGQPSDEKPNTQSMYIEFLGNTGGDFGLNYERIFNLRKNSICHFALRAGIGLGNRKSDSANAGYYSIPLEVSFILGKKNCLEVGLGWTPIFGSKFTDYTVSPPEAYRNNGSQYYFRLGYRYTGKDGVLVRVAPMFGFDNNPTWKSGYSFGISGGVSFSSLRELFRD